MSIAVPTPGAIPIGGVGSGAIVEEKVKPVLVETRPPPPSAPSGGPGKSSVWVAARPFVFGAIAGCTATTCIQPLDMIKVRLQLSGEGGVGATVKSPVKMAKIIYAESGAMGFYRGLSAGLLRQCTYGMTRLGLFRVISDKMADPKTKKTSAVGNMVAGLVAGGVGAFIGTPPDLALIRMQSDQTLPKEQRRNYKGVFDALGRIVKQEGFTKLWAGCLPTVTRAMAMNVGMLTTNEQAKIWARPYMSEGYAVFTGAMVGGFFGSAAALPFDFVKTRIQKQKAGPDGKMPYSGAMDCVAKTIKAEGPLAFYKGFWTFYFRIAPHTVIALPVLDMLNVYAKKNGF